MEQSRIQLVTDRGRRNTEPGSRLVPQVLSWGALPLWLKSIQLDTECRSGNSGCALLGGMQSGNVECDGSEIHDDPAQLSCLYTRGQLSCIYTT
jgi:hypothetical protein